MAVLASPRTVGTSSGHAKGLLRHALDTPLASLYLVLTATGLLTGLGVLMVLSASSVYAEVNYGDPYYFAKRQIMFLVLGIGLAWLLSRASPRMLRKMAWPALVISLLLLMLTFTPLGVTVNGNRNWVQFGSSWTRLQPSEFAKLALLVWGADQLTRKEKLLDRTKELVPYLMFTSLIVGLVVLQGDLGTSMVLVAIIGFVLFAAGIPLRVLAAIAGLALTVVLGLVLASPNRMRRVFGFLNPTADSEGVNAQSLRAMYALASGGWWGVGLGQSKQKWGMLVEAHNDFIFAVIGEELGLVGVVAVILLFAVLVYAAFRVASRSDSTMCRHVATGVGAWMMFQSALNMGVVLRLLPVLGVPLPFLSYGGSSLMANVAAVGLLVSCARQEPGARKALARRHTAARARVTAVVDRRG
ncbi:MAG: putative lipid II flippase FtsW [Actinobacteria bacterium]|nr:putative lipid II flippase FtsW [Actinomycetota bacterium]